MIADDRRRKLGPHVIGGPNLLGRPVIAVVLYLQKHSGNSVTGRQEQSVARQHRRLRRLGGRLLPFVIPEDLAVGHIVAFDRRVVDHDDLPLPGQRRQQR